MVWFFYALFVLLAVPLELHIYFWGGLGSQDEVLKWRPVSEALSYFYAMVLIAETAFRVAHHRESFSRAGIFFLALTCSVVLFLFIVHYMNVLLPAIRAGRHVDATWPLQLAVAALAFGASMFSYIAIERVRAATPLAASRSAERKA